MAGHLPDVPAIANASMASPVLPATAIGVFDSGIGGLSILRHIRRLLPHEHLLYFSDSRFAPYGGKSEAEIEQRALAIGQYLVEQGVKAIVVACNTATAVAIAALRSRYPTLIVVGVEPGLKPAAAQSRSKLIGVLATEATLASTKFLELRDEIAATADVTFYLQACIGLVDQIEFGDIDSAITNQLLRRYLVPLIEKGCDTLVLGCTHYPFVLRQIEAVIGAHGTTPPAIIDTGDAVARQLVRQLALHALASINQRSEGSVTAVTSGEAEGLRRAFVRLLGLQIPVQVQPLTSKCFD